MTYRKQVLDYILETYGVEPEYPWLGSPENATFKEKMTDKWFALVLSVRKKSLGLSGEGSIDILNVKAKPDYISMVSGIQGFRAGYHMSKTHWLTVFLDESVDLERIFNEIDNSFAIVSDSPTARIYEAVKKIPRGRVATYGQVAEMAGDRKMARAVGNALHKNPDPDNIPCFRVVNSKGELAGEFAFGGEGAQQKLLEAEGIVVENHKVDLKRFGM